MADDIFGFDSKEYKEQLEEARGDTEKLVDVVSKAAINMGASWTQLENELRKNLKSMISDVDEYNKACTSIINNYTNAVYDNSRMLEKQLSAVSEALKKSSTKMRSHVEENIRNHFQYVDNLKSKLADTVSLIQGYQNALAETKNKRERLSLQEKLNKAQQDEIIIANALYKEKIQNETNLATAQKKAYDEMTKRHEAELKQAQKSKLNADELYKIRIRQQEEIDKLGIGAPLSDEYKQYKTDKNYADRLQKEQSEQTTKGINTASSILSNGMGIAQGGGFTGLAPIADAGINAVSKAGPWGAIAGLALKALKGLAENILSRMDAAYRILQQSIEQSNDLVGKLKGDLDTRLQGVQDNLNFEEISKTLFNTAYNSAVINQKIYLDNISKLVNDGIAYNVEERAMLMTVSNRIATTFDALDKNLERLIRLQQADMTASQLGSEASLTSFLNRQFNDTSYLSGTYDNVNATLLEASAQMNIDQATSFMYAAQKWLGSLYALGMSDQAVNTIAQGLSYLSTGNVNQLNSNNSMQTMFAMAAENANISYSSILTKGLNADTVDALLASMVQYLGQIANNTAGNQVTKAQWADILGLSVSDLRAISNLTQSDYDAILNQGNLGYAEARNETQRQLAQEYISRMSAQELISNIFDNAIFQRGMAISTDPTEVLTYMREAFVKQFEGNGSAIEKFGHWLQNIGRLETANAEGVGSYADALMMATALIDPENADSYADKLSTYLGLENIMESSNVPWWASLLGGPVASWLSMDASTIQNTANHSSRAGSLLMSALQSQYPALTLGSWNTSLYNQGRGQNFSGLTPSAVGLAADLMNLAEYSNPYTETVSTSTNVVSSLADNIVTSFDAVQEAVESSASVVTSVNEETTDSMEKLYHMLFEEQSIPIKVYLEGLSDELKENIDEFYIKNNLSLSDSIANAIGRDASISSMINIIQTLKGV